MGSKERGQREGGTCPKMTEGATSSKSCHCRTHVQRLCLHPHPAPGIALAQHGSPQQGLAVPSVAPTKPQGDRVPGYTDRDDAQYGIVSSLTSGTPCTPGATDSLPDGPPCHHTSEEDAGTRTVAICPGQLGPTQHPAKRLSGHSRSWYLPGVTQLPTLR